MRFARVLFPTDFSTCANLALPYAVGWAARMDAELFMLHVIVLHGYEPLDDGQGFPSQQDVYEIFRRSAEEKLASLEQDHPAIVSQIHRRGVAAAPEILDYAREHDIDLIVMATHGRRGARRLLVGSVTEEVVRKASCPVLAVHTRGDEAPDHEAIRRILVPLDFSAGSDAAISCARSLGGLFGAKLDLLHVIEQPPFPVFYEAVGGFSSLYPPELEEEAKKRLRELFEASDGPRVSHERHVLTGIPAEEILRFAEDSKTDLIVTPTHGLSGLPYALLGSIAEKLVRRASCPVLVTRTPGG